MPGMNVRQLEIFHAVMRNGTISDTARALRISQPAVTKSLRLLEASLGFALFRRAGSKLFPSPAAEALLPEVARIENDVAAVAALAVRLRDGQAGRLEVASVSSLADWVLPQALAQFRRQRPGVSVEVAILTSRAVIERVAARQADLGFSYDPTDNPYVEARNICEAEVICALPRRHALVRRDQITPADLAGVPLVSYGSNTQIGGALRRVMRAADIRKEPEVITNSTRFALQLVAAGVGVAILDPFMFGPRVQPGVVARPFRPVVGLRARLIRSYERPQSPVALAFAHVVTKVAREFAGTVPPYTRR
jgi:DNA-binding transcriptional LysR family regulator